MSDSEDEIDFATLTSQTQQNPFSAHTQRLEFSQTQSPEADGPPPESLHTNPFIQTRPPTTATRTLFDPSNPAHSKKLSKNHQKSSSSQPAAILSRNPTAKPISIQQPRVQKTTLNAFQPQNTSDINSQDYESPRQKPREKAPPKPSDDQIGRSLEKLLAFSDTDLSDETKARILKCAKACYDNICAFEEWFSATASLDETGNVSDLDERRSYAKLCTALITLAPTVAAKYELDNRLWKVCFYPCIESIRAYLQTSSGPSAVSVFAKASWASLIGVAVQTFAQLLASTHRNRISSSDTKQSPSMPSYSKFVGWIGDLGRYRAIFDVDPSTLNLTIQLDILKGWYRAKHVYSVASLLAPSNGQYYYHLAVFDLNLSQTLSSLCYFIRALNVKVPYPSAHDSIVSLCLGNRAIYNESIKSTGRQKHRGGSGGGAKTKQSPPQDSESVESILVRAFEILYTRINLDRLSSILEKLNTSLSKSDDSAASNGELPTEFFQYSILLLISLLSAPDKLDESGAVSQIRLGCFQVFKVLWRAIVLRLSLDESVCSITSVDALVAFRLIISWLCCSSALECFLTTESVVALELEWGQLAALARNYKVSSGPLETPGRVLFPEDWRYRGFVPLKDVYPRKRFDVHIKGSGGSLLDMCPSLESFSAHPERVAAVKNEIWAALNKLPFFVYDEAKGIFVFKKPRHSETRSAERSHSPLDESDDENEANFTPAPALDAILQFNDPEEEHENNGFQDLKDRKTQLSAIQQPPNPSPSSLHMKSKLSSKLPSKLNMETATLLFDTNCYIRSISTVLKVITAGWHVLLPLVVITELDGLKYGGHDDARGALDGIEPLIRTREEKPSNLSLITYKGSKLPYLMIRTEDWAVSGNEDNEVGTGGGENVRGIDDVLLQCAREWAEKEAGASKKGIVILVTGDVNLRLKARGAGVFTGSLEDLKGWIGISVSKLTK